MQRYLSKISGPLLDRIDIHIEVTPVPFEKLSEERKGESSVDIRKRVTKATKNPNHSVLKHLIMYIIMHKCLPSKSGCIAS